MTDLEHESRTDIGRSDCCARDIESTSLDHHHISKDSIRDIESTAPAPTVVDFMSPSPSVVNADSESDDEFHDCLSWQDLDLEVAVDATSTIVPNGLKSTLSAAYVSDSDKHKPSTNYMPCTLSKRFNDCKNASTECLNQPFVRPGQKVASDGTVVTYWCDRKSYIRFGAPRMGFELDDGAYNPLWTMRGFTQTFHFWKENKRAQSVPLNAFLTYVTLPWWSIAKDILDVKEEPILTF